MRTSLVAATVSLAVVLAAVSLHASQVSAHEKLLAHAREALGVKTFEINPRIDAKAFGPVMVSR